MRFIKPSDIGTANAPRPAADAARDSPPAPRENARMLEHLTLIFGCQLAGELIVAATGLPVPGPVCGMALLFAGLVIKGGLPAELARVGDALLGNLSLLFVPAGVGTPA